MLEPNLVTRMWFEAHHHLVGQGGPLATVVASHGLIVRQPAPDRFHALVDAIVGQQISTKAAGAIRTRIGVELGPGPLIDTLVTVDDSALRSCGLSGAKVRSIRDLVRRVRDGSIAMAAFDATPDAEVRRALTAVMGIGRWTADMFLLFALCRPDVLPSTDLGIRVAVGRLLKLSSVAEPGQVERAAEEGGWHPFASAASLHLWRMLGGPDRTV